MDADKALSTLTLLAHGIDPDTGARLDLEGPYQTMDVIRALFVAVHAVEALLPASARLSNPAPNAALPWNDSEDAQLISLFDAGSDLHALASRHGSTLAGVRARLERHGRLPTRQQEHESTPLTVCVSRRPAAEQDPSPTG